MEPRQHEVAPNAERMPVQPATGEHFPSQNHEFSAEQRAESAPEVGRVQAEISQIAMPALPAPIPTVAAGAAQSQAQDAPLIAGDDDLIEKEWVEKAKSIIATTKDDPYRREREISKLQIEYIRKRYGRVIGESGE